MGDALLHCAGAGVEDGEDLGNWGVALGPDKAEALTKLRCTPPTVVGDRGQISLLVNAMRMFRNFSLMV